MTPVTRDALDPAPVDPAGLPEVALGSSAYDALAVMLSAGADRVLVTVDGRPAGVLTRESALGATTLTAAGRPGQARPPRLAVPMIQPERKP